MFAVKLAGQLCTAKFYTKQLNMFRRVRSVRGMSACDPLSRTAVDVSFPVCCSAGADRRKMWPNIWVTVCNARSNGVQHVLTFFVGKTSPLFAAASVQKSTILIQISPNQQTHSKHKGALRATSELFSKHTHTHRNRAVDEK